MRSASPLRRKVFCRADGTRRLAAAARGVVVAILCGAVVGVVVGGLGGRLAMRLTAVWTDGPAFTLTGAEVGAVTVGGTLSLLGSTAQAGGLLGLLYALVRPTLPSSRRAVVFAGLALVLPGGLFLGDEEFKLFDPSLVAAVLFLPLFPLAGVALAPLVERLDPGPSTSWTRNRRLVVAVLAVVGFAIMLRNLAELAS